MNVETENKSNPQEATDGLRQDLKSFHLEFYKNFYCRNGQVYENRALKHRHKKFIKTASGLFDNPEILFKNALSLSGLYEGDYITLNPCDPDLLGRAENKMVENPEKTTRDEDIIRYEKILIDVDPERKSGISSTDEEHEYALNKTKEIKEFLDKEGWNNAEYWIGDSGNGGHLGYITDAPVTEESKKRREFFLKYLSSIFSDDKAKVDLTVFNPARIGKAYGTMACKGDSIKNRPHRLAQVLEYGGSEIVKEEQISEMAWRFVEEQEEPKTDYSTKSNNYHSAGKFELQEFIKIHNLKIIKNMPYKGGTLYRIPCPFNPDHKEDGKIIQFPNGALSFSCFHSSCSGKKWEEFRLFYEPNAYDKPQTDYNRRDSERRQYSKYNTSTTAPAPSIPEIPEDEDEAEDLIFPTEAMPGVLRPFISETASDLQVPPDLIAVPMLPALASAIGGFVKVQVTPRWSERPILFTCVIAPSGEGKSPAQEKAVDPIYKKQEEEEKLHKIKKMESDEIWNSWNERKKIFIKSNNGKSEFPDPEPKKLNKEYPTLWLGDTTKEALAALHQKNPRGIMIILDELTSLMNSMNQYKGGRGNDREFWLTLWSGKPYRFGRKGDRAGDGLEVIGGAKTCINITGAMPPCKLPLLIGDKPGESTDGFAQRFLLSFPDCCPRFLEYRDFYDESLDKNYKDLFDELYKFGTPFNKETIFTLTPEAKKYFKDLQHGFERERTKENFPAVLRETWAKLTTYTLRIALVMHVVKKVSTDTDGFEIDAESMDSAIALTYYFKAHAKKVYREAIRMRNGGAESDNFRKIINIIINAPKNEVTVRDIQQQTKIGNAKTIRLILNEMIERRSIIRKNDGKTEIFTVSSFFLEKGI